MITASEIARLLNERCMEVCRHLLPQGKSKANEWCVGDLSGSEGDSLKVKLSGDKQGVWSDFASGQKGGDLIDLWAAVKGLKIRDAFKETKDYLGIKDDGVTTQNYVRKARPKISKENLRSLDDQASTYIVNQRMISEETLKLFQVVQDDKNNLVFPYFDEDGTLVMLKYLSIDRTENGKKKIWTSADSIKVLFGKPTCDLPSSSVIITEGEIDAMTCRQLGYNAVSVPFGAKGESSDGKSPNDEWIAEDYGWLAKFSKIILFMDQDEAGKIAVNAIIKRLGRERCYVVNTDKGKDANELMCAGLVDEIRYAIDNAKTVDPESLKQPRDLRDLIVKEMFDADTQGIPFLFNIPFKVRRGEITLWCGYNGHGKSAMLLQTMLHLAQNKERVCVASLEVAPHRSMNIMIHQHMRTKPTDPAMVDEAINEINDNIWLICHVGVVQWKRLIEEMRYAHARYGITQFSIDSLLKCGINGDDYNGQREFVSALADFVNDTGCHVHLVAHSRKSADELQMPSKMDVAGSGDISNLIWNGITVWRNKEKEDNLRLAEFDGDEEKKQKYKNEHDAMIKFWKQRNGDGSEPIKRLYFHPQIYTFWTPDERN